MQARKHKRFDGFQLFAVIVLTLFSIVAIVPFVWVVISSFKGTAEIYSSASFWPIKWLPQNYPDAWRIAKMGSRFLSSGIVTVLTASLTLAVATLGGYSLAKLWLSKHSSVFYCILFCMAIPTQAIVLSIYLQLRNLGLHNTYIGLVLALVGTGVPFSTYLMRSFFKDLPDSFGECAKLDGCNAFQTFLRIYLPLAKPGMFALAIFSLIGAWNEFDISLVTLTDDNLWTITLGVTQFKGISTGNTGLMFSSSVISFLPVVLLYCLFQRSFIAGITVGGNKG